LWGKKTNIAWLDFGCKIPRANHYYSENSSYDEHPRVIFKPHQKGEFHPQIEVNSFVPVEFEVTVLCQHKSKMKGCSSHQEVIKCVKFTKLDVIENDYHRQRDLVQ